MSCLRVNGRHKLQKRLFYEKYLRAVTAVVTALPAPGQLQRQQSPIDDDSAQVRTRTREAIARTHTNTPGLHSTYTRGHQTRIHGGEAQHGARTHIITQPTNIQNKLPCARN